VPLLFINGHYSGGLPTLEYLIEHNKLKPDDSPFTHLRALLKQFKLILFMKGTPSFPQDHYNQAAVASLEHVNYKWFDVTKNKGLRQAVK
jgi:glutaredoxin-related protein